MKSIKLLATLILLSILASSCGVQSHSYSHKSFKKRKYLDGIYVQKKGAKDQTGNASASLESSPLELTESKSVEDDQHISSDHMIDDSRASNSPVSKKKSSLRKEKRIQKRIDKIETKLSPEMKQALAEFKRSRNIGPSDQEPEPTTHWGAIVGLVSGIIGLLLFPFAILAIIFGSIAKREIDENPNKYTGYGLAQAGFVLGIIGLALIALLVLILVALLASYG